MRSFSNAIRRSLIAVTVLAAAANGLEAQAQVRSRAEETLEWWAQIGKVSGTKAGTDFGKDIENPSREVYRTKADVVKLLEQAVAEGGALIREQGDAGLDKTQPFGWETGKHVVRNSYIWLSGIEHSTEHFGQLVVYYRANNLVPPESRQ